MAFQQNTQNAAGGISYEDAFQLLFSRQPNTHGYVQDATTYLPQQSAATLPFRHDNTSICPHMCTEAAFTQPVPEPEADQAKMHAEIAAKLEEIRQGVSSLGTRSDQIESLQNRCNQLEIHFSEFQDWYNLPNEPNSLSLTTGNRVKASMDMMKNYIEHHRQWSLIFKRTVESQIKDRTSSYGGLAASEGSTVETQDG
jgi:hypothetical protein